MDYRSFRAGSDSILFLCIDSFDILENIVISTFLARSWREDGSLSHLSVEHEAAAAG